MTKTIGPTQWRWLIAINFVIMIVYLISHVVQDPYPITYIHYFVDYHFGFTKRALIGAIVSLFTDKVPPWTVFAISGAVLGLTFLLYLRLFKRTFGFSEATAPIFFFIVCSPFFFKHLIKSMGYFDIYGCLFAIIVLLVPVRSLWFVVLAGLGSILLILIHHLQTLLFVPLIGAIVVIRYYLVRAVTRWDIAIGAAFVVVISITFVGVQFFGEVRATPEEFRAYLAKRVGGTYGVERALMFSFIWFRTFMDEVRSTWGIMVSNLLRFWVYAVLFALQAPLIRYIRDCVRAIASPEQRGVVIVLMTGITLGYVVIFATVFDYARWMSGWVMCMFLMLHAIKTLPGTDKVPPIASNDKVAFICGCILSAFPKVGILAPLD